MTEETEEPKKYTLAEASRVMKERERISNLHKTVKSQKSEIENLKALNKTIKRAHKSRVVQAHRQDRYISKLEAIIDRLQAVEPVAVNHAKNAAKLDREEKRIQRAETFRRSRKERRRRRAERERVQQAEENAARLKSAERERLALEAKNAEDKRAQPVG